MGDEIKIAKQQENDSTRKPQRIASNQQRTVAAGGPRHLSAKTGAA